MAGSHSAVLDDGTEEEFGPGDVGYISPGHNSFVVGNERVVMVDFTGLKELPKTS
jgi:hypothetical protein